MQHILFGDDAGTASVAILVKESSFKAANIQRNYIDAIGAAPEAFIAYSLWYNDANKCPAAEAKDYLGTVLHSIQTLGIKNVLVTDSKYFKYLTGGNVNATDAIGYATPSKFPDYDDEFTVFYAPNYQAAKYNPRTCTEMDNAMAAFRGYLTGNYHEPGTYIIHDEQYPNTLMDIKMGLDWLLTKPALTVDIEGLSLEFWNCGISTIAFAWDKHSFMAFPCDRGEYIDIHEANYFCHRIWATAVRKMLYDFFEAYEGKLIPHNAGFDFKVLVYELWMKDLQDYKGMIHGIEVLTEDFDDTKIIAYLATNNAVENVLGLKPLSSEYMGNYAEDTTDTTKIPLDKLLLYNGKDALATWYVHDKYKPIMISDNQETLYIEEFKESVITLLQTELNGLPILPHKVAEVKTKLSGLSQSYKKTLDQLQLMKEFQLDVRTKACAQFTAEAKKKIFDMDDPKVQRLVFNPNSGPQVANLLYNYLGFEVIDYTDGGAPATGAKTLEKLLNHTTNPTYISIIEALIGLAKVDKILTSFIPAFENAVQMPDGSWRLYGNYNLGGTVSGRLSSSNPNLTNIPSGSMWGKLIKACFGCITGWLFGGADFNSLEDMVSALTTKDPNKLKVYTDGYDGHCLRAYSYFQPRLPGIVDTVASINSIKKLFPDVRQDSKEPTFLLTYGGTYHGLMNSLGLPQGAAMAIEDNYHALYQVADKYIADLIQQACKDGYVTGAFGLRLRTPLLLMNGEGKLGYKAAAEGRTAGNMLGQSYGMLNSRAANEFRQRIWKSQYKYDILLCGQIHDAIYIFWRNKAGITKWINDNLIACMKWCGLLELQHPTVKLGAELDIFYPDWSQPTTLKNDMSLREIINLCK